MESSFRITRIGGVEIGASWSWLIVVTLVVWSLASVLFPATYPDLGSGVHLAMAVVTALLFFTSILAHEMGHALRAEREGVPIEGITLWLFGGVARMRGAPPSPGAAFRVSAAGPAVSAVLALAFAVVAGVGARLDLYDGAQGVVDYLARINALVLAFNLVPALPLDGGRLLHAWIWHRTGHYTASTLQAATAGRVFGYLLIGVGLLGLFGGTGIGGIWIAFIGWFLVQAAGAEANHALLRRALGAVRVRDVMTPAPATVAPDRAVATFVDEAWRARHASYPVVAEEGLVGMITARAAAAVPDDERSTRRVGDVMTTRADLAPVDAGAELAQVVEDRGFGGDDRQRLPVVEDDRLVGILAPSDVARAVELGEARAPSRAEPGDSGRTPGPLVWVVVGLAFAAAAGFLYRPPLVVVSPGESVAVDEAIDIDGTATAAVRGEYRLTSVRIGRTHALGTLVAWLRPDRAVVAESRVVPSGVEPDDYAETQQRVFDESRQLAAVAGARAAGHDVPVDGSGAEVAAVIPDAPAADALEPGDVIVAVGDTQIATSADLRDATRSHGAGTSLTLTIDPAGSARRDEIEVATASLPERAGDPGLGVAVTTRNLTFDLPFEVSFPDRNIGGPSAGLAYALAVADLLDDADLAAGRTIAATGTIGAAGDVGPVGGAELKAVAAADAGADLFVVPERDAEAARGRDDLTVRSARTLEAAIDVVRSTA